MLTVRERDKFAAAVASVIDIAAAVVVAVVSVHFWHIGPPSIHVPSAMASSSSETLLQH